MGKNESNNCSTELNSMHLGHLRVFLHGGLLGTIYPQEGTWMLVHDIVPRKLHYCKLLMDEDNSPRI
jgi:hypothetical protein